MAGTVTDEIELIIEDIRGTGGGKPPSRGDDDGGGDEGSGGGGPAPEPDRPKIRKYSTAVALGMLSITVFFLAMTAAFLVLRANNDHSWTGIRVPRLLWANTAVLLLSSATIQISRRRLDTGDAVGFRRLWAVTTFLGVLFVAGQAVAWRQLAAQGVYQISRQASGFFYSFTGLHAAHLLGGVCALIYVAMRKFDNSGITRSAAAKVASYYWHFMDGLWLFLLTLLYFGQ